MKLLNYAYSRLLKNNLYSVGVLTIYSLIAIYFYKNSLHAYFQSDEWYYFLQFFPLLSNNNWIVEVFKSSIFSANSISGGGHLTPMYSFIWAVHVYLFGLNYDMYIKSSILLHIINSFLVYQFFHILLKNKYIAFISGLFFVATSSHSQAVTWIMAYVPTQFAFLGIILSLIWYVKSFVHTKRSNIYLFLFTISTIFALLTKETSVLIFFIAPCLWKYYSNSTNRRYRSIVLVFVLLVLYVLYRFGLPKWLGLIVTQGPQFLPTDLVIFRMFSYPLRMLVSEFLPTSFLMQLSEYLTTVQYPYFAAEKNVRGLTYLSFIESAGADIYIYSISVGMVIGLSVAWYNAIKNRINTSLLLLGIVLCSAVGSAWPLIFISAYAPWWGYVTFIDSRHLYVFGLGGAALIAYAISGIMSKMSVQQKNIRPLGFIVLLCVILWTFWQYSLVGAAIAKDVDMAKDRKYITSEILNTIPRDSKSSIILFLSDTGYYGFDTNPPFQNSLGEILAVHLYTRKILPVDFLTSKYLVGADIFGQGYMENGGFAYGFYGRKKAFFEDLVKYRFDSKDVYAFSWNGKEGKLTNSSEVVRNEAKRYVSIFETTKEWKMATIQNGFAAFKVPPEFNYRVQSADAGILTYNGMSQEYNTLCHNREIIYETLQKDASTAFHIFLATQTKSNGEHIGENFKVKLITPIIGNPYVVVIVPGEKYEYYIPSYSAKSYMKITADSCLTAADIEFGQNDNWKSDVLLLLHTVDLVN